MLPLLRPLQYENFGDLIQSRSQIVLPMSANELERAIVGPAERIGMTVEAELLASRAVELAPEEKSEPYRDTLDKIRQALGKESSRE